MTVSKTSGLLDEDTAVEELSVEDVSSRLVTSPKFCPSAPWPLSLAGTNIIRRPANVIIANVNIEVANCCRFIFLNITQQPRRYKIQGLIHHPTLSSVVSKYE